MYSEDDRINGPFLTQVFMEDLGKVSNKGWSVHKRVLELDKDYLSYYRKVPPNFHASAKGKLRQRKPYLFSNLNHLI